MIPEEAKLEILKKRAAGQTWTGIANWLKETFGIEVHRTTIQRCHDREVLAQDGISISLDDNPADNVKTRITLDKKVATFKGEAALWKKLYQQAIKDSAKKEIITDAIMDLAPSFNKIPLKNYSKPSGKFRGEHEQTVIAPLTDTHVGEAVFKEQMMGLNTYDFDVFNQRLYGWANQVLNLVNYRRNIAPVNDLIVPMLGDMISGDIHEELARSNIANCMEQMIRGANLIAQALMFLAPHFETIKVPCVVGNHGRMTRKPPMKDKYLDWDYMLYQWVATFCKNQDNLVFEIPKSYLHIFSVYDHNILIMHGDSVSGAGSNASITGAISKLRGVLQYKENMDEEEIRFDSAMIGHFHRIDEIDIGTGELHICGTMKGPDEFALQRLHAATKPKHLVTYWHPKYGYIGKEVIYLDRYADPTTKDSMFNDFLPDNWSSAIKTNSEITV
tara:strand:+ start:4057 stop:5391 length:1335 start_codon:yes stop_codon:yes gene_type:complete